MGIETILQIKKLSQKCRDEANSAFKGGACMAAIESTRGKTDFEKFTNKLMGVIKACN